MNKPKIGDKYIIEIDSHMTSEKGELYGVKGIDHLVFDQNGLEKLTRLEEDDLHVGDVVEDEYGRTAYVLVPRNKFGEHTLLLMKDYAFPQWANIKDWRKIIGHNVILESYVKEAYAAMVEDEAGTAYQI